MLAQIPPNGHLQEACGEDFSCSRCQKQWTSIVFVPCVFTIPVCKIALHTKESPGWDIKCKIHKMQIKVTCATSKCKPIRFKFCMRGFPITAQYPTKGRSKISIFNFSQVRYWHHINHAFAFFLSKKMYFSLRRRNLRIISLRQWAGDVT